MTSEPYQICFDLLTQCRIRKLKITAAESCTAGLLLAALTEIPGASEVIECGFVTYSNASKIRILGVSKPLIDQYGAVSKPVSCAMAEGALLHAQADIAIAISGIAGPSGGSLQKPVGTVHLAIASTGKPTQHQMQSYGEKSRSEIRQLATQDALHFLRNYLS